MPKKNKPNNNKGSNPLRPNGGVKGVQKLQVQRRTISYLNHIDFTPGGPHSWSETVSVAATLDLFDGYAGLRSEYQEVRVKSYTLTPISSVNAVGFQQLTPYSQWTELFALASDCDTMRPTGKQLLEREDVVLFSASQLWRNPGTGIKIKPNILMAAESTGAGVANHDAWLAFSQDIGGLPIRGFVGSCFTPPGTELAPGKLVTLMVNHTLELELRKRA